MPGPVRTGLPRETGDRPHELHNRYGLYTDYLVYSDSTDNGGMVDLFRYFSFALLLLSFCVTAEEHETPTPKVIGAAWVYSTAGDYLDVKADLVDAIESRGIVISYTAHAASMLQRTASAVGALGKAYDHADILLFCKADLAYSLTIKNPHNISLCPYSIAIYTLASDWETVFLSIRAPDPRVPEYAPIQKLLEDIIGETLAW